MYLQSALALPGSLRRTWPWLAFRFFPDCPLLSRPHFSFFAFEDLNGNHKYDAEHFESCGWLSQVSEGWWLAPVLVQSLC